jgi:hypothetical protein
MLLNIKTGYNGVTKRAMDEIAILVSSLREIHKQGLQFAFTDRHAYLQTAEFHNNLERLDRIDWPRLQASDFRRDSDDPGKVERYQAEALIHRHLPITAILGIRRVSRKYNTSKIYNGIVSGMTQDGRTIRVLTLIDEPAGVPREET